MLCQAWYRVREENNSRPSAKNRPKGWNGRLFTQLTRHQADQSRPELQERSDQS